MAKLVCDGCGNDDVWRGIRQDRNGTVATCGRCGKKVTDTASGPGIWVTGGTVGGMHQHR